MWLVLVEQDKFSEVFVGLYQTREFAVKYTLERFFVEGATEQSIEDADDVLLIEVEPSPYEALSLEREGGFKKVHTREELVSIIKGLLDIIADTAEAKAWNGMSIPDAVVSGCYVLACQPQGESK